jgi:hypothetical protein
VTAVENPNEFRLQVNVQISNAAWASGAVSIRDEVVIAPVGFQEMAQILEAFHVLCEKYKKHG